MIPNLGVNLIQPSPQVRESCFEAERCTVVNEFSAA